MIRKKKCILLFLFIISLYLFLMQSWQFKIKIAEMLEKNCSNCISFKTHNELNIEHILNQYY